MKKSKESNNISMRNINQAEKQSFRTGCTLLDLVVGGGECLGFPPGKIVNVVGDKSAGKSLLCSEVIACNYHGHKNLIWNYDDSETGYTFNTEKMYGVQVRKSEHYTSRKVEDFDVNINRFLHKIKENQIGIYVLDSLDGLSNSELENRSDARLKAANAGKEFKDGSYGMQTPKFLSSEFFSTKTDDLSDKKIMLIIVSQVRENIDPFSFKKFNRRGGKALDFYAHTCLWLATAKKIKKNGRVVGVVVKAHTDKSKTARPFRECVFTLYFDYGIDNIGSCLDYLYDLRGKDFELNKNANAIAWDVSDLPAPEMVDLEKILSDTDNKEKALQARLQDDGKSRLTFTWLEKWILEQPELKSIYCEKFGKTYTRDELIEKIESDPVLIAELEKRTIEKWEKEEAAILTGRKPKYGNL